MENLCIIQENEFSVTESMHPSKMQPFYTYLNELVTSGVSQIHILTCMLNIAICRTCPEAVLPPVSPTGSRMGDWFQVSISNLVNTFYAIRLVYSIWSWIWYILLDSLKACEYDQDMETITDRRPTYDNGRKRLNSHTTAGICAIKVKGADPILQRHGCKMRKGILRTV